ncbi:hypothetical protein [Bradyrhizobium sp. LB11.1]|uniref:hypothetical protein n=1 Tax=Bradyrhizobium sp. LB11.1 TaxID=3156326 RepID=UPI00339A7BBC
MQSTLTSPSSGVDPAVWLWVSGARYVNSATGAFANYIRQYTAEQYFLRTGEALDISTNPSGELQKASNLIAQRFILTLFGVPLPPNPTNPLPPILDLSPGSLVLPDLHQVGLVDAGAAAAAVFPDVNYSPWAGTVLFSQLGDNSFFKDWVLTTDATNGYKKEAGTYDLASVAKVTTDLYTFGFELRALATDLSTVLNVLALGTSSSGDAASATNAFFSETYGVPLGALDIGNYGDSALNCRDPRAAWAPAWLA